MKKMLAIAGLIILSSAAAIGQQQTWSLSDCLLYARDHNLVYRQSLIEVEKSKANLAQSKLDLLPSLDLSGSHSLNFGRSVDPTTYTFSTGNFQVTSFSLSSGFTLYNGFSKRNTIKLNEHGVRAYEHNAEEALNNIAITITQAYLQVLLSREQLDIADQQLLISKDQEDITSKLVNAGSLPEGNLLEIKAQVAQNEYTVVNAANQMNLSIINLQLLLDLPPNNDFKIAEPTGEPSIAMLEEYGSPADLYARALEIQPSIKSANESLIMADYNLKIAKAYRQPSVNLFGNLNTNSVNTRELFDIEIIGPDTIGVVPMTGDIVIADVPAYGFISKPYPTFDQFNDNLNQSYGISVRIPIFNGGQVRNSVQQARFSALSAEISLQQQQSQLRNDIEQYYANTLAAARQHEAAKLNLEAVAKSFDYIRLKSEQGLVKPVDFTTAQTNLQIAQSNLIQAKYSFLLGLKILDFYIGKPLNFD